MERMKVKTIKETVHNTVYYKKCIYSLKKQEQLLSKVVKMIEPITEDKSVMRILIYGSVARWELGKYDKPYHGRIYSDFDVLIISDGKIKIPSSFKEDLRLPEKIAKITKKVCYRYNSKNDLEGKFSIHIHVFDKKVHDKKLALKKGLPVAWPNKKRIILIYQRK